MTDFDRVTTVREILEIWARVIPQYRWLCVWVVDEGEWPALMDLVDSHGHPVAMESNRNLEEGVVRILVGLPVRFEAGASLHLENRYTEPGSLLAAWQAGANREGTE